jgi:fucose 4-O-acetylase-like acetyltransferase
MIFDGWFPLLPWFSVALLGYLAEQYNYTRKYTKYYFIAGIINFIGSYSLFIFFPASINYPREKYLEIFYPISIIFSIQLCGIFTLILIFINSKIELKSMVTYIGKSSLFVYLIHTIIIKNILTKFHFTFINIFVSFFINGILFLITIYISCTIISFLKPYLLNNKITKPILFILGL